MHTDPHPSRAPSAAAALLAPLLLILPALPAAAQQCGPGDTLLKNDILPAVPSGTATVAVVPGLCDNEAAMSIFNTGGAVSVRSVAVLFGSNGGTQGVTAVVDVEIYDGVTALAGGKYQLGPLLYRSSTSTGSNVQVQSHGLNTFTLPVPVRATSGKLVVGFRMLQNLASGSCAVGYSANFATDFGPGCVAGRNILDAIGHGPVDPATYGGFGLPLCPLFFRGDWVIRACVTPEVSVAWTGNPTPGGVVSLSFIAPGHGGETYLALASGGVTTGFQTPWGLLPLDNDFIFQCFFGVCRTAMFFNDYGTLDPSGNAAGGLLIPNLAQLKGLTLYVAFVTSRSPTVIPFSAVSTPSSAIRIQ